MFARLPHRIQSYKTHKLYKEDWHKASDMPRNNINLKLTNTYAIFWDKSIVCLCSPSCQAQLSGKY